MRFKKLFIGFLLATSLITIVGVPIYAENTGTAVAGTSTTNNAATGSATTAPQNSSGTMSINDSDTNVGSAFGGMFSQMGDPTKTEAAKETSKTIAPIIAGILGFFFAVIPLVVLAYTGLELACIFIKPIRPWFGAEGGSGGGEMGGSGKEKVLIPVSEDCLAVLSKGGGGGGEMGGGSGPKGLSGIALEYLKLRSMTLVICLVTVGLFLTPVGYNLLLLAVDLIFGLIGKIGA